MEVGQERRRICRDTNSSSSSSLSSSSSKPRIMSSRPTFKKVQILYYLSRNGHLEHPHYMEVTHLAHQHLRLKDVVDRLTSLRGKGMPSLYSWSCKRSYKNGFVWNDLSENDIIFPSEGAEYVLKGSELIDGCTEKMQQQLQLQQEQSFQPKRKNLASKRQAQEDEMMNVFRYHDHGEGGEEEEEEEEEEAEEYEEKTICGARGAGSTEEVVGEFRRTGGVHKKDGPSELILHGNQSSSPPSTTSSTVSNNNNNNNNDGKRSEDGDPVGTEPLLSRNSMLLSLIACGGSASFRKAAAPPCAAAARKSGGNLQRGVVCRAAAKAAKAEEEDDEMMMMIGCMSENPRFGNLQAEEKEYFSGSIVETMANGRSAVEGAPGLKRSSSHNEERSAMTGLGDEDEVKKEVEIEKGMRGKCLPRKKSSSSSTSSSSKQSKK